MKQKAEGESARGGIGAVIVAAGSSCRMGSTDKIFAEIGGKPVIVHVLDVFQHCSNIDRIVLVLNQKNIGQGQEMVERYGWSKVVDVCIGGARRQDSVKTGLSKLLGCEYVIIHDGARPFVTEAIIQRGLTEAKEHGAAVAAVPAKDTVKIVDSQRTVIETPSRDSLWLIQTPQIFRYQLIYEAYRRVCGDATDDATLVEQLGYKVKVYLGDYNNIKITTLTDIHVAAAILRAKKGE